MLSLGGKLDSYLKRIGKGSLDVGIRNELNSISEEISNGSVEYDIAFVKKWNILVADLCGKISLFDSKSLSDSINIELEKEILSSVKLFYERLNESKIHQIINDNEKVANDSTKIIPKRKTYLEDKTEISIHLDNKYKGFTNVLLNGKKANVLTNSTDSNIRILVERLNKVQTIVIVTTTGDTCQIERYFNKIEDFPIRFVPECLTQKSK